MFQLIIYQESIMMILTLFWQMMHFWVSICFILLFKLHGMQTLLTKLQPIKYQHIFLTRKGSCLSRKVFRFSWIDNLLFYIGPDQVMRRCVREDETYGILHACHNEPCRGHFTTKRTTFKILTTSYYWPTLHKDAINYTRKCDKCQRMG